MYPEVRIKKQIGKKLCNCVKRPVAAGVRINYKHRFSGESETIEIPCRDL